MPHKRRRSEAIAREEGHQARRSVQPVPTDQIPQSSLWSLEVRRAVWITLDRHWLRQVALRLRSILTEIDVLLENDAGHAAACSGDRQFWQ